MRRGEQLTSNNYLRRALADGAKPFRYRSGVRSLLGAPEKEAGRNNFPPGDMARRDGPAPRLEREKSMTETLAGSEKPDGMIGKTTIEVPGASMRGVGFPDLTRVKKGNIPWDEIEDGAQREVLPKDETRSNGSAPGLNRGKVLAETREKLEKPGAVIEMATSKTAGTSEGNKPISVSFQPEDGHAPPGEIDIQARQEASSSTPRRNFVIKAKKEAVESHSKTDFRGAQVKNSGRPKGIVEISSGKAPFFADAGEKHTRASAQASGVAAPQRGFTNAADRSNKDAADTIEQLRTAVRELTARGSSRPADVNHEPEQERPRQIQHQPVEPVVIIKRSPSKPRVPHAFWERSYLGRFHLRPLR